MYVELLCTPLLLLHGFRGWQCLQICPSAQAAACRSVLGSAAAALRSSPTELLPLHHCELLAWLHVMMHPWALRAISNMTFETIMLNTLTMMSNTQTM